MDSVRFGRALGVGARAAAKTLVTAVDAASSPSPSAKPAASSSKPRVAVPSAESVAEQVARAAAQAKQTTEGLNRGGKQLGQSVWNPFVRLSGVLWLEFTGVFFGIFAVYAISGTWKLRSDFRETAANHDAHMHFVFAAVMAVVFSYFCVSSFLRARRRERGR